MFGLEPGIFVLLCLAIACACAFEFVNGFHDTANAVATVIYTNSLAPRTAVTISGILNFSGVMLGGISVAMGIISLLPLEALIDQNVNHGLAMILALLVSAILWNLGTWYLGLPASSSHTLIGSLIGVGLGFGFIGGESAVNWHKASETGMALLISPLVGFGGAILLMFLLRGVFKRYPVLFSEPPANVPPPWPIRIVLWLTCSLVSFFHGMNDGQKGVGLVMLILILMLPGYYSLNPDSDWEELPQLITQVNNNLRVVETQINEVEDKKQLAEIRNQLDLLSGDLANPMWKQEAKYEPAVKIAIFNIRKDLLLINKGLKKLQESNDVSPILKTTLNKEAETLVGYTHYAPVWVLLMISLSLGIGTMVGWKRIVLTIGEKIGKQHLTYAQGATAEVMAATTIGLSSGLGLPVSTTHVLSSGIAGTMVASNGLKNLQAKTIRSIAMAWVLTLPVCILMSAGFFLLFRVLLR